jgi:cysteine-rich repeat protein
MMKRMHRRKTPAGVAAALLLILAPSARATINATGSWSSTVTPVSPPVTFTCTIDMTQAGTTLTASSTCIGLPPQMTGTIDSSGGAFTLSGFEGSFCLNTVALSGTFASDGSDFTASAGCAVPAFPFPLNVAGSRCGNGVLDPGEVCDDGNQQDFDCCSSTCQSVAPEGSSCGFEQPCQSATCDATGICQIVPIDGPCDDFNQCTTNDTCVDGFCQGQPVTDGTSCDDFNPCSVGDSCQGGFCYPGAPLDCGPCSQCEYFQGCVAQPAFFCPSLSPGRSTLRLRDDPSDKKDVVAWQLDPAAGISIGDLGDPRSETSYQLCVFESDPFYFDRLLAGLEVPAGGSCNGKPCWIPKRNGYRYTDKAGTSDGVRSVRLEAGDGKQAELSVFAKGPGVGLAPLPATLPVTVQLQSSDGACWEADFLEARLNGPLELRARKSSPSGAFLD